MLKGRPPVNDRFIWMVRDFLLATTDFELNEKISWSTSVRTLTGGVVQKKGHKLLKLMKELFKKYQLEIVQPDVGYIVKKF